MDSTITFQSDKDLLAKSGYICVYDMYSVPLQHGQCTVPVSETVKNFIFSIIRSMTIDHFRNKSFIIVQVHTV